MVAIPHCLKMRTGNKGIDLCILFLTETIYRTFALNACQAQYFSTYKKPPERRILMSNSI